MENPEINLCTYGYLIFDGNKERIYSGENTASSINGTRKTGQLDVRE